MATFLFHRSTVPAGNVCVAHLSETRFPDRNDAFLRLWLNLFTDRNGGATFEVCLYHKNIGKRTMLPSE